MQVFAHAPKLLPPVAEPKKRAPLSRPHAKRPRAEGENESVDKQIRMSLAEGGLGSVQAKSAVYAGYEDLIAAARVPGTMGMPGDRLEREADQMDEAVVSTTTPPVTTAATSTASSVQRSCEVCANEQNDQGQDTVQHAATAPSGDRVALSAIPKDAGSPPAMPVRGFMESRFGHDF